LNPEDIHTDLRNFCVLNEITLYEVDVGYNQEPFLAMNEKKVQEVIILASSTVTL